MKSRTVLRLLALLITTGSAHAQIADTVTSANPRIAHFDGDRKGAISYTFDDNLRDQFTVGVPMLNEVGFKGTFFVIPNSTVETPEEGEKKKGDKRAWGSISWPELKQMAAQGHEIASHTWSHPNLVKLYPERLEAEFSMAYESITSHIGTPPLTVAFPFNADTPEVQAMALKYHVAYRSYQLGLSDKSTVESLNKWADKQATDKSWGVLMTHGVAEGYAALTDPEIFRTHLKYVKEHEKDLWVDTFANIARYAKERDDAKLTVTGKPGNVTCVIVSTLDAKIYQVPLTLLFDAKTAKFSKATRAGKDLPSRVADGIVYVQAAPAPEPITVQWK